MLVLPLAHPQTTSTEDFYLDCIRQEIQVHEVKANLVNSRAKHYQQCAEDASAQARFYRRNTEELVQEVLDQGISKKTHAVRYFLVIQQVSGRTKLVVCKQDFNQKLFSKRIRMLS